MLNFKEIIAKKISLATEIDTNELENYIEIPPNKEMGDYAFPCFKLAKALRKAPPAIAAELKEKIELDGNITKVDIVGGYLNFFVNKVVLTKNVLTEIEKTGEKYGANNIGEGKNVIVEYSSPNIAKPFHIGHLRNTVIGAALYKIYKYLGYNVTGINHLGDYGTQFGKMIEGYKRWGNEYDLEENPIDQCMDIYVRINNLCKEDEKVLEMCRENFKKIEDGEPEYVALWNKFKELSLKEFEKIYGLLDVKFDSYNGEAFYSDKMDEVVEKIDEAGALKDSEGAKIVDLEDKGLGVCIIKKSDGTSIYATRDLASLKDRINKYDFDKAIYVVGNEQRLHFKQVFKVLELMGYEEYAKNCVHVPFGLVVDKDGEKIGSRKGNSVFLMDSCRIPRHSTSKSAHFLY